mmetsp:Transcript_28624/g.58623  ORF Transcript_28624/g.58623 Transcript_28624/m.58623 type:complete len:319 (+) Transcript_28624:958-1914(+)
MQAHLALGPPRRPRRCPFRRPRRSLPSPSLRSPRRPPPPPPPPRTRPDPPRPDPPPPRPLPPPPRPRLRTRRARRARILRRRGGEGAGRRRGIRRGGTTGLSVARRGRGAVDGHRGECQMGDGAVGEVGGVDHPVGARCEGEVRGAGFGGGVGDRSEVGVVHGGVREVFGGGEEEVVRGGESVRALGGGECGRGGGLCPRSRRDRDAGGRRGVLDGGGSFSGRAPVGGLDGGFLSEKGRCQRSAVLFANLERRGSQRRGVPTAQANRAVLPPGASIGRTIRSGDSGLERPFGIRCPFRKRTRIHEILRGSDSVVEGEG